MNLFLCKCAENSGWLRNAKITPMRYDKPPPKKRKETEIKNGR